jgi:2-oxoglutarate ferredoxin oxidoreductase subunit gamma
MIERLIIAGAGGQGIMLMGRILALAALREGKQVSWIPAYGAEVRGGAAYCMVIISDKEIASPFIVKADSLIIMNAPSLDKFKEKVDKKGLIIINSSLAKKVASLNPNIQNVWVPFTEIAVKLGNIKVANMVALGAYIAKKRIVSPKAVSKVIKEVAPPEKKGLIEINQKAISVGIQSIRG